MDKKKKEFSPNDLLDETLNLFGLKIDLGELLASPENLEDRLEDLRERLEAAGGKEGFSEEEWKRGGATITGHIRTRGILGDEEYHIGAVGKPRSREKPTPKPQEEIEPPVDVFDDGQQVTIVADVPGTSPEDLELKVDRNIFSLSTRESAQRRYRKELRLNAYVEPNSLQSTCHNGVLEVRVRKQVTGNGRDASSKQSKV